MIFKVKRSEVSAETERLRELLDEEYDILGYIDRTIVDRAGAVVADKQSKNCRGYLCRDISNLEDREGECACKLCCAMCIYCAEDCSAICADATLGRYEDGDLRPDIVYMVRCNYSVDPYAEYTEYHSKIEVIE